MNLETEKQTLIDIEEEFHRWEGGGAVLPIYYLSEIQGTFGVCFFLELIAAETTILTATEEVANVAEI